MFQFSYFQGVFMQFSVSTEQRKSTYWELDMGKN